MTQLFSILVILVSFSGTARSFAACPVSKLIEEKAASQSAAIQAMQAIRLGASDAEQKASQWIDSLDEKQRSGRELSVMEHAGLVYLFRKGFHLPSEFNSRAENLLVESWNAKSGGIAEKEKVIQALLPKKALQDADRREKQFHEAVFLVPMGGEIRKQRERSKWRGFGLPALGAGVMLGSLRLLKPELPPLVHEAVGGAMIGYSVGSAVEYLIHRYLTHPSKDVLRVLKRAGFDMEFYSHGYHHGIFSPSTYTAERSPEWLHAEKNERGQKTLPERDERFKKVGFDPKYLHDNQYGNTENFREHLWDTGVSVPIAYAASLLAGLHPTGLGALLATAIAPSLLASKRWLHPLLHMSQRESLEKGGPFSRRIMGTSLWRYVSRTHNHHHSNPSKVNFELFGVGPDQVFGTYERPDLDSLLRMESLDLFY